MICFRFNSIHRTQFVLAIAFLAIDLYVSSCTAKWMKAQSTNRPPAANSSPQDLNFKPVLAEAELRKDWQQTFMEQANKVGANHAILLLSEAGYVDGGQFAIYLSESGGTGERVARAEKKSAGTKQLSKENTAAAQRLMTDFANLADFSDPVFDAVRYEVVFASVEAGEWKLKRRIKISYLPADDARVARHSELVKLIDQITM
jgi:hypothetical protein